MGPRRGGAESDLPPPLERPLHGFNGAAPGGARKGNNCGRCPVALAVLQWGRARGGAEIVGTVDAEQKDESFNGAAPGGRGNCRVCRSPSGRSWASMGPRRGGAETDYPGACDASQRKLQWGRARGARKIANPPETTAQILLQWGRARGRRESRPRGAGSADEMSFNGAAPGGRGKAGRGCHELTGCPASMGPRPGGRGKRWTSRIVEWVSLLQWGRARGARKQEGSSEHTRLA